MLAHVGRPSPQGAGAGRFEASLRKGIRLGWGEASAGWVPGSLSFPGPLTPAPPGRGNYIPNRLIQALPGTHTRLLFKFFLFLSG